MDKDLFLKTMCSKRDYFAKKLGIENEDEVKILNNLINTEFGKFLEKPEFIGKFAF